MVARNPNNLIGFGHTAGIAEDIHMFTIDGGATLANETNPGEAMEAIIETIGTKATILAVGAEFLSQILIICSFVSFVIFCLLSMITKSLPNPSILKALMSIYSYLTYLLTF
mgnify:CR=1 FL=1